MKNFFAKHMQSEKIILCLFVATLIVVSSVVFSGTFFTTKATTIGVSYRCHFRHNGWKNWVSDGAQCAPSGPQWMLMDGIQIRLNNAPKDLNVRYRAYIESVGWKNWVVGTQNGVTAGTTGPLRMGAIQIQLTGLHSGLGIKYQTNVQKIGWRAAVSDGAVAGITSNDLWAQDIKIKIVTTTIGVSYRCHFRHNGWKDWVSDDARCAPSGPLWMLMDGIQIRLNNAPKDLNVRYRAYIESVGWKNWVVGTQNGVTAGTTGPLRMGAIQIQLTGLHSGLGIKYQTNVQKIGWQAAVSDGAVAGITSNDLWAQDIKLKIVPTVVSYKLTLVAGAGGKAIGGGTYNAGVSKTITATPNAGYSFSSWTGSTGCSGSSTHTILTDKDKSCTANFKPIVVPVVSYTLALTTGTGGTVSGGGVYNTGTTRTISATANTGYAFNSWTGSTGCSGTASHTILIDSNKSCMASFTQNTVLPPSTPSTPSTPVVTVSTPGVYSTWSWPVIICEGGNSIRYQYRYSISPTGFVSTPEWNSTNNNSIPFTTSTINQTYTLAVQAQCYNTTTSSPWSVSGSASYFRSITPTPTPTGATFNVINYGAKGDGVTDDAPAFQRAFNAAHSANGGTVLFPSGKTYRLATNWEMPTIKTNDYFTRSTDGSQIWSKPTVQRTGTIVVSGYGATIKYVAARVGFLHTKWTSDYWTTFGNLVIEGFTFDNNNTRPPAMTGRIFWMGGAGNLENVVIRDVKLINVPPRVQSDGGQINGVLIRTDWTVADRLQPRWGFMRNITIRDSNIQAQGKPIQISLSETNFIPGSNYGQNQYLIDEVLIDNVKTDNLKHVGSSIHLGGAAAGKRVIVRNSDMRNSSDDGLEINAFDSIIAENNTFSGTRQAICLVWFGYPYSSTPPNILLRNQNYTGTLGAYWPAHTTVIEPGQRSPMMPEWRAYTTDSALKNRSWGNLTIDGGNIEFGVAEEWGSWSPTFNIGSNTFPMSSVTIKNVTITADGPNSGKFISIKQGSQLGTTLPVIIENVKIRRRVGDSYVPITSADIYLSGSTKLTFNSTPIVAPVVSYTLALTTGTGGTVSGGGVYNTGTTRTISATANTGYAFNSWTGSTGCSGTASHTILIDSNKSCMASFTQNTVLPPSTPSTPVVTVSTPGAYSTWSWPVIICEGGNSIRYQYRYSISPTGFVSTPEWNSTNNNSITFTTSTINQTYTLAVQAQCYNTTTSSPWSVSGSASYFRVAMPPPTSTHTITVSGQDATSIDNAITSAKNLGAGTTIYFPSGSYSHSNITWPDNINIKGDGISKTKLNFGIKFGSNLIAEYATFGSSTSNTTFTMTNGGHDTTFISSRFRTGGSYLWDLSDFTYNWSDSVIKNRGNFHDVVWKNSEFERPATNGGSVFSIWFDSRSGGGNIYNLTWENCDFGIKNSKGATGVEHVGIIVQPSPPEHAPDGPRPSSPASVNYKFDWGKVTHGSGQAAIGGEAGYGFKVINSNFVGNSTFVSMNPCDYLRSWSMVTYNIPVSAPSNVTQAMRNSAPDKISTKGWYVSNSWFSYSLRFENGRNVSLVNNSANQGLSYHVSASVATHDKELYGF